MTVEQGSAAVPAASGCKTVDQSNVDSEVGDQVVESFAPSTTVATPSAKVQLRPVGHPSPVTLLFEYTVKAWDNQKGDHCTYKYLPSRDPACPMDMVATVLVRLPNKQPLYVKDSKPRSSRVVAQNSVAQLALEKLAVDDSELADKLEVIRTESAASTFNPPQRYQSSPWSRRQYRQPHYYAQYPPQAYYMPRSTSDGAEEFPPPPPPPVYYMPPMMYEEMDPLVTPTHFAPPFGFPGFGYMPPEMMYYPPPMMMMAPPGEEPKEASSEPTTDSSPSVY